MDSKSVHRVAESLGFKSHFDSKLKLWTIGGLALTVEEVASMSSLKLREKLTPSGGTVVLTGKQLIAESKDSGSDLAAASQILGEHKPAATPAKAAKPKREKSSAKSNGDKPKTKRTPPKREANVFKIDGNPPTKPKRDADGKLWLRSFGIHKWALRNKAKARGADKDVQKLLAQPTHFYSRPDIKRIARVVFDDHDKSTLKAREQHTAYAIKCAEDARKIAEAMLQEVS